MHGLAALYIGNLQTAPKNFKQRFSVAALPGTWSLRSIRDAAMNYSPFLLTAQDAESYERKAIKRHLPVLNHGIGSISSPNNCILEQEIFVFKFRHPEDKALGKFTRRLKEDAQISTLEFGNTENGVAGAQWLARSVFFFYSYV